MARAAPAVKERAIRADMAIYRPFMAFTIQLLGIFVDVECMNGAGGKLLGLRLIQFVIQ